MTRAIVVSALFLALAVDAAGGRPALAQIFRWTDEQGHVHYSQGVESVPQQFRAGAAIVGHDRPAPPDSPAPAPEPSAVGRVRFTPGQPIMVAARINGSGTAELMLDTGATRTVINPRVLEALGVSYQGAQRGSLRGVTGDAEVTAVRVDSIEVSGVRYGPLLVVSHDTSFGRGDGLLGRDFLDQFTVNIDNAAGIVTLTPR
jgi:predicted aspartyl protease